MKRAELANLTSCTLRWSLICILAWTAGAKLFFRQLFAERLTESGFFPEAWVAIVAVAVPVVELALALSLATRLLTAVSLCAIISLSTVFAGIHGYALWHGVLVPCGCAGRLMTRQSGLTSGFMFLIALSMGVIATAFLFRWHSPRVDPPGRNGMPAPLPEAS